MPWSSHCKSHSHLHFRPHPECNEYYGRGCVQTHNGSALKSHNGLHWCKNKAGSTVWRYIKHQHVLQLLMLLSFLILQLWEVTEKVIFSSLSVFVRQIVDLVHDSKELNSHCFQQQNSTCKLSWLRDKNFKKNNCKWENIKSLYAVFADDTGQPLLPKLNQVQPVCRWWRCIFCCGTLPTQ